MHIEHRYRGNMTRVRGQRIGKGGQPLELVGAATEGTNHDRQNHTRVYGEKKNRKQSDGFSSLVPWTSDKGMWPEVAYRTRSITDRFCMLVDIGRIPWAAKSYQEMLRKFGASEGN